MKKRMMPILLSMIVALIGIVLLRNEVFFDDWYIESAADGLFGANNRNLLVVGAHFLFTGLIYVLSLTGIRLSWIHVLMFLINTISSYMLAYMICDKFSTRLKYIFAGYILLALIPFVYFYMQFTTTAAYCIGVGCLWLFYIPNRDKRSKTVFGIGWIILGCTLRLDAIFFSIAFMGSLGIIEIAKIFTNQMNTQARKEKLLQCWQFMKPFLITLCIAGVLGISQRMLMEQFYPGFVDWNEVRAKVDDYDLDDYYENEQIWQNTGISYNDYCILKSWNNLDENFFTEKLYKEILESKDTIYSEQREQQGLCQLVIQTMGIETSNYSFVTILMLFFVIVCVGDIYAVIGGLVSVGGMFLITMYFCYIKRIIWRTEWSIDMLAILTMITVILCFVDGEQLCLEKKIKQVGLAAIFFVITFLNPVYVERNEWSVYNGKSMGEVYCDRAVSSDTYGKYVLSRIVEDDSIVYATIDQPFTNYTKLNSDILYYHLFTTSWLQSNPLTNRDIFRSESIGAGQNWGSLGQYICRFNIEKNIENDYGVRNRFSDLINNNIRVTVQNWELYGRTKELNIYLMEHYYDNVDFSVTKQVGNVVIGRYMTALNVTDTYSGVCDAHVYADFNGTYEGMLKLVFEQTPEALDHYSEENLFVEFQDENENIHTYQVMRDEDGMLYAIIHADALDADKQYSVSFIINEDTCVKEYKNKNLFQMESISNGKEKV